MMTNPYRANPETALSTPAHGCVVCRTQAALAHVNWLRVTAWIIAGALPIISVTSAAFAYASVTMTAGMLATAEMLGSATARRDRPPKTPPVRLDPAYPAPPKAMSACTSVERDVYRDVLLAALNEDAPLRPRIVPEQLNGKMVGLRIFGVREDSGLSRLGLVNGDLVLSINGFEIASPQGALEVYERVQTADEVVVELSRRGVARELRFHVRPGGAPEVQRQKLAQRSVAGSKPVVGGVPF